MIVYVQLLSISWINSRVSHPVCLVPRGYCAVGPWRISMEFCLLPSALGVLFTFRKNNYSVHV